MCQSWGIPRENNTHSEEKGRKGWELGGWGRDCEGGRRLSDYLEEFGGKKGKEEIAFVPFLLISYFTMLLRGI